MAGSRLENLSTIFARCRGLITSGALQAEKRPLWYDVYERFPPQVEPLGIREVPTKPIRTILYHEDEKRAVEKSSTVFDFVSTKSKV